MGASSSSPSDSPHQVTEVRPISPPPVHPPVKIPNFPPNHLPSNTKIITKALQEARPHACASRLDDFAFSLYNWNFSTTSSRWKLFYQCMRSEKGSEPRDPHINVPEGRLPRWDPANPWYDPKAPYNSFPWRCAGYTDDE